MITMIQVLRLPVCRAIQVALVDLELQVNLVLPVYQAWKDKRVHQLIQATESRVPKYVYFLFLCVSPVECWF